ncbi:GH32 C-terminal domain-containing protein [Staphylococcus aureus]|nr:GH32 C-terminal domain-containing protein [Staphylococcus aureus]
MEKLRHNKETALGYANKFTRKLHPYEGKQYELIIDILDNDATEVYFELRTSKTSSTLIAYNKRENKITLDRSDSGLLPTNVEGTTRSIDIRNAIKAITNFC